MEDHPLEKQQGSQPEQQKSQNNKMKEEGNSLQSTPVLSKKQEIRKELESMEFQPHLIQKALQASQSLEQAIQFIVTVLEAQDQTKMVKSQIVQLVIFVRMDLNMSSGKIAAQCAHATLKAFQNGRASTQSQPFYATTFIQWLQTGRPITYYRVSDQKHLFETLQECRQKGAPTTYIRDAGRTQVAAGSATVGAVGPLGVGLITEVIKKLIKY